MTSKSLLGSSALALVAAFGAGGAFAQTSQASQPSQVEEVIVTGSLIGRSDLTSASPISVVSNQQIVEAGTLNISEIMKVDPSIGVQSRSNTNTLSGAGQSNVNLRNLGSRRTLALINGRRVPLFADAILNASQDISIIPSNLVQRVDVLRDGASTTYGADAVAGVVNFILRDRFDGFQTEAYSGISSRGDADSYRVSGLFGKTWDRGSIVVSALYQDQKPVMLTDRAWARRPPQTLALPAGPNTYGSNITPGGAVLSTSGAQLACFPFVSGVVPQADPNCPRYDIGQEVSLIGGMTLSNVSVLARYDVTDKIRFSADILHSHRQSWNDIFASQILTSGLTGNYLTGFRISAASANNPYGQDINIRWRPTAYGSRPQNTGADLNFVNLGFDGDLFDNRLHWKFGHSMSQSKSQQRTANALNTVSLYNLLNTQACAADNLCSRIGAVPNIPDLLSGRTLLTKAQQDYLFYTLTSDNKFTSTQDIAQVSGKLMTLPAGDVNVAIAYEHRKEEGVALPDAVTASGAGLAFFVFPTRGQFSTNEVFGEVDIPLLADAPFAKELTLNLQGRYSDFSNFHTAKTYKVGINYAPVEGLRFRGAYGTSFRAPDVVELYGGGTGSTFAIVDPCNAGANALRATNATVNANCNLLGAGPNFFQSASSEPSRAGGNPALRPEEGRTITFGVVFQPTFWPSFSATIDAYDITIKNAIGAGNLQLNLNTCYADSNLIARSANPADVCYSFADRQPNGQVSRLNVRSGNLQRQYTSGVDFNFRQDQKELPVLPGSFVTELRLSYVRSFKVQGVELANTINAALDGAAAYPRLRGNLTGTYSQSSFDVQWQVNFVDKVRDLNYGGSIPTVNLKDYSGTPRYFSHDVLVRWRAKEDLRISAGVNNLFDKDPPYVFGTTRPSSSTMHDQIGRYFFMNVVKDW